MVEMVLGNLVIYVRPQATGMLVTSQYSLVTGLFLVS